jgi:putative flippase GtrA
MQPSRQLVSFVVIGVACTAAFAVLYTVLRHLGAAATGSNALALILTMGVNFAANRRFTFQASDGPLARQLAGYAVAYLLGLAASTVALVALLDLLHHPHGLADTAAGVTAGLAATVVRFVLMRAWVFRAAEPAEAPAQ